MSELGKRTEIKAKFKAMGFTRVYCNSINLEQVMSDLKDDLGVKD